MGCLAISIHGSLEHQKAICGRNSTFLDENEKKMKKKNSISAENENG